jgi:aldehyde:ferredoxin oxidoreductase
VNKKWYGWSGSILEVDLTDRTVQKRPFSERMAHQYLGQAGINARMLYERTSAATDPYSPAAPLIFGVGPLAGTMASLFRQIHRHVQIATYGNFRRFELWRTLGTRNENGRL